ATALQLLTMLLAPPPALAYTMLLVISVLLAPASHWTPLPVLLYTVFWWILVAVAPDRTRMPMPPLECTRRFCTTAPVLTPRSTPSVVLLRTSVSRKVRLALLPLVLTLTPCVPALKKWQRWHRKGSTLPSRRSPAVPVSWANTSMSSMLSASKI